MRAHSGLLEPDAGRPARPVLRGPSTREGPWATRLGGLWQAESTRLAAPRMGFTIGELAAEGRPPGPSVGAR